MKRIFILFSMGFLTLSATEEAAGQDVGLKWFRDFGSARDSEFGIRIHTDRAGYVYTTGAVGDMVNFNRRGNIPVVSGFPGNVGDVFITRHDPDGNLIWVRTMGGTGSERGNDITTDREGNVYVTGNFNAAANFDPGGNPSAVLTPAGGSDVFVAKYNSMGIYQWAKKFGGTSGDDAFGVRVDSAGYVYVAGGFSGQASFGTITLNTSGVQHVFVAKLDPQGEAVWAHDFGVGGPRGTEHRATGLDLDRAANVYVTGYFAETVDFNPSATATANLVSGGGKDAFVLKLTADGNYVWAKSMSGPGSGNPLAIRADGLGSVYVAGWFTDSMDVNPGGTASWLRARGGWDGFVTKYDEAGNMIWNFSLGSTGSEQILDITTDRDGNLYMSGYYEGMLDFDPDPSNAVFRAAVKSWDIFAARYSPAGALVWVKTAGGEGDPGSSSASDVGHGIAVDTGYNVYVTGYYQGTVDFDPGPDTAAFTTAGKTDVFIWKLRCPLTETSQVISDLCSGVYEWNGIRYTETGLYTQSFYLGEGCDSVATLDLTLGETLVKPSIGVNQDILSVRSGYASYQWLINDTVIHGATDSFHVVTRNGAYRVAVTNRYACADTSETFRVNNVSVSDPGLYEQLSFWPNPARTRIYIRGGRPELVSVCAPDGRQLLSLSRTSEVTISDLPAGIYLITAYGAQGKILLREKLLKID